MFRTTTSANLSTLNLTGATGTQASIPSAGAAQKPPVVLSYEIIEGDNNFFMEDSPTSSPRRPSEIKHDNDELEEQLMQQLQAMTFADTLETTVQYNSMQSIHGGEEDEKSPGTASTPSSTTIGMTLNTASPTSVHVSTDEDSIFSARYPFDEEDEFYHSNEFDYWTPQHVMDEIDQDTSRVMRGKGVAKEMEQFLEKTRITQKTQPAPQIPAPMPAAFAADPKSVPLTPSHVELQNQHFENLRYYVKSGLLFTNHDSHTRLQKQRQRKPKALSTDTSVDSSLHSHFTFSPSHSNSNN